MFAYQKFNYEGIVLKSKEDATEALKNAPPVIERLGFDTETTGLNIINDTPFLMVVGFDNKVYAMEVESWSVSFVMELMQRSRYVFAHNATYDYHMLFNTGMVTEKELRSIRWADSMAVARLTQYADITTRLSLEALGKEYVLTTAKEAATSIRSRINEMNRSTKQFLKERYEVWFPDRNFSDDFEKYTSHVQYTPYGLPTEVVEFFYLAYSEADYLSIYMDNPNLMISYAMDDVVIMLEYLKQAIPTMTTTDPEWKTFLRECDLIHATVWMERVGIKVDIEYMLQAREKVMTYRDELENELNELTEPFVFRHSQSKAIIDYFNEAHQITINSADELSLRTLRENIHNGNVEKIIDLILELRTVENKILSTYIEGKLNEVFEGRIYPRINNQGAVSGRMSCSMQQQPKDALVSRTGEELFHPRKAFIADEGTKLIFMDYNQMELRIQANYTVLLEKPDLNLCRAYIPLECVDKNGLKFDPKGMSSLMIESREWYRIEDKKLWVPSDLHAVTTFKAFPHLGDDPNHPDFKHYRRLGKVCNFLKNYQGGVQAIKEQLGVSDEIAQQLDKAYYEAFPNIKEFQRWVQKQMTYYNYVTNLMGRRYYMNDARWFYKAGNYLVQGTAADLFKDKIIKMDNILQSFETRMALPVHDEMMFIVPDEEIWLVPYLHAIMEDTKDVIEYVPMTVGIDISATNWADKEEYLLWKD